MSYPSFQPRVAVERGAIHACFPVLPSLTTAENRDETLGGPPARLMWITGKFHFFLTSKQEEVEPKLIHMVEFVEIRRPELLRRQGRRICVPVGTGSTE